MANSPELAYEWGECLSAEFDFVGAKWWWGPEVDVNRNRFHGIGHCRVASDYQDAILKIAKEQVVAMQKHNIAATAKHFPGGGMFEPDYVLGKEFEEAALERTRAMSKKLAEKSLTLMFDKQSRLPFDSKEIKKVAIICSTHVDSVFDNLVHMKESFEKRGATVHLQRRLRSPKEMQQIAEENDLIVYAAYIMPHQPIGLPAFYGDECRTFSFAFRYGKEKSVGISMGSPYLYYDYFSNFNTFVNSYNSSPETQEAFVAAIYGEIPFEGASPFKTVPDRGKVY